MKKYIYKFGLLTIASAVFLISCDEDVVDFNGQNFVTLNSPASTTISISEDVGTAVIPVTMAFARPNDVVVNYTLTSTVAQPGQDFTVAGPSITIPAGQLSANIEIAINDNDILDDSKNITLDLTSISDASVSLGTSDVGSYRKIGLIVNDDCTTEYSLFFGELTVTEGGSVSATTGGVNATGDCNILVITGDVFGFGAEADKEIPILFTPASEGATSGTVTIGSQLYCQACNSGLNLDIAGTGTYNEVTRVIVINYTITRSDGATASGTVRITPAN